MFSELAKKIFLKKQCNTYSKVKRGVTMVIKVVDR